MSDEPDIWDEIDDHTPCFLVHGAPTGRFPHGYTSEPILGIKDEPEGLDGADWKRYIRPRADQSEAERLAAEQRAREQSARLLSQEQRMVRVQAEAATKRRDVRREMWVLRNMQRQNRPAEVIEKRLQTVERIVYLGRAA